MTVSPASNTNDSNDNQRYYYYSITGVAAHGRIAPLLPVEWIDVSPYNNNYNKNKTTTRPQRLDFVWENAPRQETLCYRTSIGSLLAYNHLPNATNILDSKWALARLFDKSAVCKNQVNPLYLATLETHCFRGKVGFDLFYQRYVLNDNDNDSRSTIDANAITNGNTNTSPPSFPDLLWDDPKDQNWLQKKKQTTTAATKSNLWVIKDAGANGAGGVWILNSSNSNSNSNNNTKDDTLLAAKDLRDRVLHDHHKYVAQKYVWPMVLYGGRKFHVRAYALITSDGRAFLHQQCFLHVANHPFDATNTQFQESSSSNSSSNSSTIHITNCCANSHDPTRFAGEICANLKLPRPSSTTASNPVIGLQEFLPSIQASLQALAERSWQYIQGGPPGSFEYLGLDFILSYTQDNDGDNDSPARPLAYLLEVNAPPSQDTATGLLHAENLHNAVLQDLIHLWVLPNVMNAEERPGGWMCVYQPLHPLKSNTFVMTMNRQQVTMLNRFKWALQEQKALKHDQQKYTACVTNHSHSWRQTQKQDLYPEVEAAVAVAVDNHAPFEHHHKEEEERIRLVHQLAQHARTHFAYFDNNNNTPVFLENAGGSQVPRQVVAQMTAALQHRHRTGRGKAAERTARQVILHLLTAGDCEHNDDDEQSDYQVYLGPNASTLLANLARAMTATVTRTSRIAQSYSNSNSYNHSHNHCTDVNVHDDNSNNDVETPIDVVIAAENHQAHVTPWLEWAQRHKAMVKWWMPTVTTTSTPADSSINSPATVLSEQRQSPSSGSPSVSTDLASLVTHRTRIVAVSHASNLLGELRNLEDIGRIVKQASNEKAFLVVDGVAAVPHVLPNLSPNNGKVDAYVLSCHKVFGPHLGALLCRREFLETTWLSRYKGDYAAALEVGTANYEACQGVQGMLEYMTQCWQRPFKDKDGSSLNNKGATLRTRLLLEQFYSRVRTMETLLVHRLLTGLKSSPHVRILQSSSSDSNSNNKDRLPVVSFWHERIPSDDIEAACQKAGLICRSGTFLSTPQLLQLFGIPHSGSNHTSTGHGATVVRCSMVHYNTPHEMDQLIQVLQSLPLWF